MARIIRHTHIGPYKLEPQPKPVWICMCGLSQNLPFCDSSHKKCAGEAPGLLHQYDPQRLNVTATSPEPIDPGATPAI